MKKGIFFTLLIFFFVFLFSAKTTFAIFGLGQSFGGKILHTKDIKIQAAESAGYHCLILGSTITIAPLGSPAGTPIGYFIPASVIPKTRTTPMTGQFILGKYAGTTSIECLPPHFVMPVITVPLSIITMFGTSKF